MCGIVGILGSNASKGVLNKMLLVQKHRGPDFTGTFFKKNIALGHNRLSIIDISENANQPFISSNKRFVLCFNGEIYNYLELKEELKTSYSFITTSDTEVLLAAYMKWGKSCLSRLNGMFSFAIWDNQESTLFAARDRFGVKPFYYAIKENSFYFASEIKTLFEGGIPKNSNDSVWSSYFVYGSYGMPNQTFWEGINQLPGGNWLEVNSGKVKIKRWYIFEEEIKKHQKAISFQEVKETYKNLLEDSIKLRFRSDVPVGFNISGGLDSSALLCFVNKNEKGKNIDAYTFYTGNSNYDELPWVRLLLKHTKNPLNKVLLKAADVVELSTIMSSYQDEPFGGIPTLAYGQIFSKARRDGVKVLLDGQGMDEQWAGYDYYLNNIDTVVQGVNKSPFRPEVLNKDFLNLAEKPSYIKPFKSNLLNLQYRDLFFTKIPRALRFNDRISMANSTELREPFLDYRLVEFAFAQPVSVKIKDGIQKFLLRSIVSEHLSSTITYAPKRALQTPQREWLANDLREWVREEVDLLKDYNWFDSKQLDKELNFFLNKNQESSFHIWQWVNASLLLKSKN
jgi:asparagine synthase (glutamine-hydrolysing)